MSVAGEDFLENPHDSVLSAAGDLVVLTAEGVGYAKIATYHLDVAGASAGIAAEGHLLGDALDAIHANSAAEAVHAQADAFYASAQAELAAASAAAAAAASDFIGPGALAPPAPPEPPTPPEPHHDPSDQP